VEELLEIANLCPDAKNSIQAWRTSTSTAGSMGWLANTVKPVSISARENACGASGECASMMAISIDRG
jgi:hypothetical protein